MPTQTDRLKSSFFLRQPGAGEESIKYTHTELSRLLIDLNSRFAKINTKLAIINTGGNGSSDLEPRVDSLETNQATLFEASQNLAIRVGKLEEETGTDELEAQLKELSDALEEVTLLATSTANRITNPGMQEAVTAGTNFLAYTMQEFSFDVDFTEVPANAKLIVTAVVTDGGTMPPELSFAGTIVDQENNKVLVRYINNTPANVLWPATLIILHTFY